MALAALVAGCNTMGNPHAATTPPPAPSTGLAPLPVPLTGQAYSAANPFAKILRGELPAAKVYEDDKVLAFMDIAPVEFGHVLVISKTAQARNLLEIDDADLLRIIAVAKRVGRAQVAALGADGFSIEQNNGYGQTVGHLHVHVIPRYRGGVWGEKGGPRQTAAQLEPIAARIRAVLTAN